MGFNPKQVAERIAKITTAWETIAPGATFAGMTLAQYKNKVKPSLDSRDDMAALEAQSNAKLDDRNDADGVSRDTNELVVNAVRGDPTFGSDHAIIDAMGYTRKSERKSGLTKKKKEATGNS